MEKFSIQSLPEIIVASHREVIPDYAAIGPMCVEKIGPEMQRLGCKCPPPGYSFTIEHNNEYRNRGLNVFSLAHEFKSTDAMRKAVERHAFPWPCFVDLDDEFGVFHKHGTQNSALFFIDHDGTIIAVPNSVEELKAKLKEIFNDNK